MYRQSYVLPSSLFYPHEWKSRYGILQYPLIDIVETGDHLHFRTSFSHAERIMAAIALLIRRTRSLHLNRNIPFENTDGYKLSTSFSFREFQQELLYST